LSINRAIGPGDDDLFNLLGWIVWKCAFLESFLREALAKANNLSREESVKQYSMRGPSLLISDLRKIFGQLPKPRHLKSEANTILDKTSLAFEERNSYVHGLHYRSDTWLRVRLKVKNGKPITSETAVTKQDMEEFLQLIEEIDCELEILFQSYGLIDQHRYGGY